MLFLQPQYEQSLAELSLETALEIPKTIDLVFDGNLVGEGWHSAELYKGVTFRWMGMADSATVDVVVDRSTDVLVTVEVPHIYDGQYWGDISFALDGRTLPHEFVFGAERQFKVTLPAGAKPGVTTLSILAPFGASSGVADPRRRSIAVSRLTARPTTGRDAVAERLVLTAAVARYIRGLDDFAPVRRGAAN